MTAAAAHRHDGLRLAELLAARLCQDVAALARPLAGAAAIARSEPGEAAQALAAATLAAEHFGSRLRLLRAAWAGNAGPLDRDGLAALCAGLPHGVCAELGGLAADRAFPAGHAQLLLNLLLLAAGQLPRGGTVALAEAGPDAVLVVPDGPEAAWPRGLAAWVADPEAAWRAVGSAAPEGLQGPFAAVLAHRAGARLSFALAADAEAAPPLMVRFG